MKKQTPEKKMKKQVEEKIYTKNDVGSFGEICAIVSLITGSEPIFVHDLMHYYADDYVVYLDLVKGEILVEGDFDHPALLMLEGLCYRHGWVLDFVVSELPKKKTKKKVVKKKVAKKKIAR